MNTPENNDLDTSCPKCHRQHTGECLDWKITKTTPEILLDKDRENYTATQKTIDALKKCCEKCIGKGGQFPHINHPDCPCHTPTNDAVEKLRDWIETALDADAHGKWVSPPSFKVIQDVAELLAPRINTLIASRERGIVEEMISHLGEYPFSISGTSDWERGVKFAHEGYKQKLQAIVTRRGIDGDKR